MARMPRLVRKRKKSKIMGSIDIPNRQEIEVMQIDTRIELIRSLVPLGLSYVMEELNLEVDRLAGARYSRKTDEDIPRRHGTNPGSVKLAGPDEIYCFYRDKLLSYFKYFCSF